MLPTSSVNSTALTTNAETRVAGMSVATTAALSSKRTSTGGKSRIMISRQAREIHIPSRCRPRTCQAMVIAGDLIGSALHRRELSRADPRHEDLVQRRNGLIDDPCAEAGRLRGDRIRGTPAERGPVPPV